MPIAYPDILELKTADERVAWNDQKAMLYALGVGLGSDPLNAAELPFVYENGLKAIPTMATVIGWGAGNIMAKSGINYLMVVHGEQRVTLHKPLPSAADVTMDERVLGVFDKGADKGAVLVTERVMKEAKSGDKLCTLVSSTFARGDGGFGGPKDGAPEPHKLPDRKPDLVHECDTRPDQAFIYALSGDRNPLHRDPKVAKMAGFPRPILHGLCTYGTACRAVISSVCNYDPHLITGFDVRFSAPVFPGETIVTEMWVDGQVVSFRSRLKERDVVVLNNGKCTLAR